MNQDQLRDQIAALFRSAPGNGRLGDEPPGTIADEVLRVVAPLLADRDEQLKMLKWLHAEAVRKASQYEVMASDAESEFGSAMAEVDRAEEDNNRLRLENNRLRREVEFEANGADTFSGADALAEQVGPQCSVHPTETGASR